MTLITRRAVLAAKIETTPGTAETLANADAAFNAMNVVANPQIEVSDRMQQGSFRRLPGVPGARGGQVSFSIELVGDGAGGTPGWTDTFFPACGLVEAAGVFTPRNEGPGSNVKTLTIGVYENGRRKLLSGCAGNVVFEFTAGQTIMCNFTFTGLWQGVSDQAELTPTYPTRQPLRAASTAFTIASVTPCFETMTIDLGNNVILRPCSGNATGFVSGIITDRRPVCTMDPEAKLVATDDRYGRWLAQTTQAFSYAVEDAADEITFAAPAAQIINVSDGDRSGLRIDNTELLFCASGSNAEFSITFAAA